MNQSEAPIILGRDGHDISRSDIDADALKVLYRLSRNGHQAYLVGGSVRDLMLGRRPKDFDIATDAKPAEILDLFSNSRIIGRRFPIVHILFGRGHFIEVATFRSGEEEKDEDPADDSDSVEQEKQLLEKADSIIDGQDSETPSPRRRRPSRRRHMLEIASRQAWGSPAQDARRRDLTINGLFYSIADFTVIDYVDGLSDLEGRIVRIIGDADTRITEDPVRMIRALRHAARLGFEIEEATWQAILRHREKIHDCSRARIVEEFYRDLRSGAAHDSLDLMRRAGLLELLLPISSDLLKDSDSLAWRRLAALDNYVVSGGEPSAALLLGSLITFPMLDHLRAREQAAELGFDFGREAYRYLKRAIANLGVSRRDTELLFLISISQRRLDRCRRSDPVPAFFRHKNYFDSAWRLMALDLEARGQEVPDPVFSPPRPRGRRRRRSRRQQR